MSDALAHTGSLTRFALRRDRLRNAAWVGSIGILVVISAASVKGLFPTQHDLDVAAQIGRSAPAVFFNGPPFALDTLGGQVAYQLTTFELVVVGLMSSLTVARLLRGEEESGRLELVRSLPVGAHAPTVAAVLVVFGMDLAVGFVTTVSLLALGLPAAGSILLGVSVSLLGLLFAALAALVAQVTENTRIVNGLIGVVLGMSFVVRGVGDINGGTWSWCSPIGWAQKTRPFAGDAWWPLLVVVTCAATAGLGAAALSRRRDLGGALLRPRAGPARATASLGHPLGLAFRLHRGVIAGWALGVVAIGAAYGSIGDTIDQYVVDNKAMADLLSLSRGASVTDAYFATATSFTALLVAGYALQAALRPRTEEAAARACAVVVAGVSRRAWLLSHAAVTALGTVSVLAVGGMGTGIAYGVVSGHWSKALAVAVAAWAYVPAVWVLAAIAFALVGSAPRATLLAWLTLAWCVTVGLLGELLHIPTWARDLSPIELVPRVPASAWSLRPLVAMVVAAGLLLFAGVHAFGRRDIDVG